MEELIVILGPTASGKTDLAISLAKEFNGEIVSADSRQIYKEMDIGTAKPPRAQSPKSKIQSCIVEGIPHYLIDIVYPNEDFSVAVYKKLAIEAIKDIQKRGKLPFLVGGTGLYIKAVVDNIKFPKVPAQKKLRERLEKKSQKELFGIYKKLDPEGAESITKENKRRLIRAIEVCKVTGKPFWQQRERGEPLFGALQIGIRVPEEKLKRRISQRVNQMLKLGLEKEVKMLWQKYGFELPAMQSIGYQEWENYFKKKITEKELEEKIKVHTIQFAKRQMTWFKKDKRIHWIPPTSPPQDYAKELIKEFLKK